jgi:formate hydrogenlyase subunit 3/multisubunit Na+/H+ antiporter MnhD subunit
LLIKSNSSILFWFLLEILTVVSYGFITLGSGSNAEQLRIYFTYNSFSGCFILFGVILLCWEPIITDIIYFHIVDPLSDPTSPVFITALLLIIFGLLLKLGYAPNHL